jgi:hypothetical protein
MKNLHAVFTVLGVSLVLAGCAANTPPAAVYGAPARAASAAPVTLERALSDANVGRPLAVKARVAEVCRMKGCWMVLTDGPRTARVTFRDYAFLVPKNLVGKTVIAEGTLSRRVLSAEEAEHLDAESSSAAAPAPGPREEWSLVATSVIVPAER